MDGAFLELLARWLHFLGGLVWVGHNYASAVARPRYAPLAAADLADPQSPKQQALLQREHGMFRYASLVTWGSGVFILADRGWLAGALTLKGDLAPIGVGFWIGTLMLANLWLVLWPNQKRVLGFISAPLDERLRCSRRTFLSGRVNTMLSVPLLFFMAAGAHGQFLFH